MEQKHACNQEFAAVILQKWWRARRAADLRRAGRKPRRRKPKQIEDDENTFLNASVLENQAQETPTWRAIEIVIQRRQFRYPRGHIPQPVVAEGFLCAVCGTSAVRDMIFASCGTCEVQLCQSCSGRFGGGVVPRKLGDPG